MANNDIERVIGEYMRECIDENDDALKERAVAAGKAAAKARKNVSRNRAGK